MPSLYEFYVIFSVFAILNAQFFYHVGIYNFVRAINISGRALTSSNVHLDFQLTGNFGVRILFVQVFCKLQDNEVQ